MGTGGRSGMDGGRPRDSAAPAGPLLRTRTSRWISQDLKRERAKGKGKGKGQRAKAKAWCRGQVLPMIAGCEELKRM